MPHLHTFIIPNIRCYCSWASPFTRPYKLAWCIAWAYKRIWCTTKTIACSPNYCDIVNCQVEHTERALRFVEIKVNNFWAVPCLKKIQECNIYSGQSRITAWRKQQRRIRYVFTAIKIYGRDDSSTRSWIWDTKQR